MKLATIGLLSLSLVMLASGSAEAGVFDKKSEGAQKERLNATVPDASEAGADRSRGLSKLSTEAGGERGDKVRAFKQQQRLERQATKEKFRSERDALKAEQKGERDAFKEQMNAEREAKQTERQARKAAIDAKKAEVKAKREELKALKEQGAPSAGEAPSAGAAQ